MRRKYTASIILLILLLLSACSGDSGGGGGTPSPDMDGDGIADNLDNDRDGDGVPNTQDSYPNDATRSKLPAVRALQSSLQQTAVQLQWQALTGDPQTTELLAGYNLYRNTTENTAWVKLNTGLINSEAYTDSNVTSAIGYRYKITAVDTQAIEGLQSDITEQFVAYNTIPVENFSVALQGESAQLNWAAQTGLDYQIYRSLNSQPAVLLNSVSTNQYTDNTISNNALAGYQLATLQTYTDIFTGQPIQIGGPLSAQQTVVPVINELTLSINNTTTASDAGLQLQAFQPPTTGTTQTRLTGQYSNTAGSVTVTASTTINNQPVTVTRISSGGQFTIQLPATQQLNWQISVSDNIIQNRQASVQLRILTDTSPPLISIDGASTRKTSADKITLSGTVNDLVNGAGSGIKTVLLQSARFKGVSFSAFVTDTRFNAEIPLQVGDNIITAIATDLLGNATVASVTIKRNIGAAPRIEINSPQTGTLTNNNRLNITGTVYSSQASEKLRINFQNQQIFPTPTAQPGIHSFSFSNINLQPGVNTLPISVNTPQGNDTTQLQITYEALNSQQNEVPVITILSPADGSVSADNPVIIRGNASSTGGILRIKVNGVTVATGSATQSTLDFQYSLDLSGLADGEQRIRIEVNDGRRKTTTRRYKIIKDTQPPVISLSDSSLLPSPQINTVRANPYTLSGTVTDANIAGFSINARSVKLLPGVAANSYTFDAPLALPAQQNQTLTLTAWDQAGQQTQQTLILLSDVLVAIDIISPENNSEIQLPFTAQTTNRYPLDITARLSDWLSDYQVSVIHEQDAPQTMNVVNGTARLTLPIPLSEGKHSFILRVHDAAGELLSEARTNITLINAEQIPLQLIKSTPANESTTAEPHQPISLFFNRPIDRSKIQLNVYETYSGLTYDLKALEGKSALENQQVALINVDRNHQVVAGGIAFFPENTLLTFYPDREFAYGAQIFIDVTYNNQPLAQHAYTIRPLPTFVQGTVIGSEQLPLAGIKVSIAELGRTAITNNNGNFGFGFGDSASNTLPAGRYKMLINPGLKDRRYGILERWLNIEQGRINRLAASQLQRLYANAPFSRINSASNISLFDGELKIDLSQATLYFPDGRREGDIHVQLIEYGQLPYASLGGAIPHWMYGIQPMGIKVNGPVSLDITMPALNNRYDYIPADGTLVVLLGYNSKAELLMPVGVGQIQNRHVTSAQAVQLDELSYLGYALVQPAQQSLLQNYRDGSIALDALKAGLNP